MDNRLNEIFQSRIWRLIHQLDSQTVQSFQDIRHEMECICCAISQLLWTAENEHLSKGLSYLQQALDSLDELEIPINNIENNEQLLATKQRSGLAGRPLLLIPIQQLTFFIENGFKLQQMADILGVSKRTVSRRLAENNLSLNEKFSLISDAELDGKVEKILSNFPNIGYRSMKGHLLSEGHILQEYRVRESMRRVDSEGVVFRKMSLRPIWRRTYNVPAPNSLWHIDGYHKLIRWRFVIHGGVDGFSRMPVFLKVNENNKADTVLDSFLEGVNMYGLPDRVRSDKGGENVAVADFMIRSNGDGRGSHITGRSVHNQRIERFWRDLWTGCIVMFYQLFYYMETVGILNVDEEIHLEALHFVYLPRIQNHLDKFVAAFIRRPLRTCSNQTPLQLFIQGQILSQRVQLNSDTDIQYFGASQHEFTHVEPDDENIVRIPETRSCLSDDKRRELQSLIDPLSYSSLHGIDIYESTLDFLNQNNSQ